jgi:hypothetical protein
MNRVNITLLTLDLHTSRQFWPTSITTLIHVSSTMCYPMHIHTFMQYLIFMHQMVTQKFSEKKKNK